MKTVYLTVPQWYPMNPYLAPAILVAEARAAGFDAFSHDLNADFFNDILTKETVLESARRAKEMLPELVKVYEACDNPEKNFFSYSKKIRTSLLRLKTIKEFFETKAALVPETAGRIDDAVAVMKDRSRFYDPEQLFAAKDVLADALAVISLPYAPARIMLDNYIANPVMTYSFEDVREQCYDRTQNMFIDYFEKKFDAIPIGGCELVNISVTDLSQLVPALTLGRMIKERTGQKVCFGGNYIYKIKDDIIKYPAFFDLYCDYIICGDGETASVEMLEFADGSRKIEDVHSLIWCDHGAVRVNPTAALLKLDELQFPNFDYFDFSQYFSADIVFPVQFGKGCYWGKCKFCDFYTGQQKFDIKSVTHAADEVEYLVNRYHARHFAFVDEAVPPAFYARFADEILRRGLKINFYSFARFDAGFTRPVLEKLFAAGARFFSWGYEAASPRLLELMNKGIDPAVRDRILRDCLDIGYWTQCTFLLGYPTETPEELKMTQSVILNRDLINSCTPSNFVLKKNAILKNETENVGITDFTSNGDFHISYSYSSLGTSMAQVKKNRLDFEKRFLESTTDCLWSLGFTDTDHLLLYLSHHGRDFVRDYRLRRKKKPNGA